MEFKDQPIDAALAAWKTLSSLLATTCANSEGRLDYRRAEEFGVLIQEKKPPGALKLEYSPELKKLRYNTGISGWQELSVVELPQRPAAFETPYHREYTVDELCNLVLEELDKTPLLDGHQMYTTF